MNRRTGPLRNIRINILVGVLLVTPIATTIVVLGFLFRFATGWLPEFFDPLLQSVGPIYLQRVIILLVTMLLLYMVGILGRNLIGRRLYRVGDWMMARIPVVRDIYSSVSRIIEALFSQRNTMFKEAVILEYPRPGIYAIGFITANLPSAMIRQINEGEPSEPWVSLFVPTTPNPTSGVLICAPRSQVIPLAMPISDALTFVISAGAVARRDNGSRTTLMDRIDEWLQAQGASEHREDPSTDEH